MVDLGYNFVLWEIKYNELSVSLFSIYTLKRINHIVLDTNCWLLKYFRFFFLLLLLDIPLIHQNYCFLLQLQVWSFLELYLNNFRRLVLRCNNNPDSQSVGFIFNMLVVFLYLLIGHTVELDKIVCIIGYKKHLMFLVVKEKYWRNSITASWFQVSFCI